MHAGVLRGELDGGIPVYCIDAPQYFARPFLYGTADGPYLDNAERFAFFSRAVLALAEQLGAPDVLHCHDWQAALAPVFLRADAARYPTLAAVRTVMTIHNLGYQGLFWHFDWHLLNLDWRYFTPDGLEFYGKINYLKGGIVFADAITTVSPTYAREIQTPELGCGLDGVLVARRHVAQRHLERRRLRRVEPGARRRHRRALHASTTAAAKRRAKPTCRQRCSCPSIRRCR